MPILWNTIFSPIRTAKSSSIAYSAESCGITKLSAVDENKILYFIFSFQQKDVYHLKLPFDSRKYILGSSSKDILAEI